MIYKRVLTYSSEPIFESTYKQRFYSILYGKLLHSRTKAERYSGKERIMNVNPSNNEAGTGKAGVCLKGNLSTPYLDKNCNGINVVIPFDDAVYLPMLLKELKFSGKGPEIEIVELLPDEELFDIRAMLATIDKMKKESQTTLKKKNRKTGGEGSEGAA